MPLRWDNQYEGDVALEISTLLNSEFEVSALLLMETTR
jgi:hypothetical protein